MLSHGTSTRTRTQGTLDACCVNAKLAQVELMLQSVRLQSGTRHVLSSLLCRGSSVVSLEAARLVMAMHANLFNVPRPRDDVPQASLLALPLNLLSLIISHVSPPYPNRRSIYTADLVASSTMSEILRDAVKLLGSSILWLFPLSIRTSHSAPTTP